MESAIEKAMRALLLSPRRSWRQAELAKVAGCSKAYISKLVGRWLAAGILGRPRPQEIVLLGAAKLLAQWAATRRLPRPVYVSSRASKAEIERLLKRESGYALTLWSAAWHRIKFMRTSTVELYVPPSKAGHFVRALGKRSREPTPIVILPAQKDLFAATERVAGLLLVAPVQNYVDLMAAGGSGVRVALELAKRYNLMGV